MRVQLYRFTDDWDRPLDSQLDSDTTLVLLFGEIGSRQDQHAALRSVCATFPRSIKSGGSRGSDIYEGRLEEYALVLAVIRFDKSRLKRAEYTVTSTEDSHTAGDALGKALRHDDLRGVFLIGAGERIDEEALTDGINRSLPKQVVVTGGVTTHNYRRQSTHILSEDCHPRTDHVSAVGYYGDSLRFIASRQEGWERFGIEYKITSARGNILYTLNHKPALEVYRNHLGKLADKLPGIATRFPLAIHPNRTDQAPRIHTIIGIDETNQTLLFPQDIPVGHYAMFMKADTQRLLLGACEAAHDLSHAYQPPASEALNITVSSMRRKRLLLHRTDEEPKMVRHTLPEGIHQVGFYSDGTIAPTDSGHSIADRQTLVLTLIWEP